MSSPFASIPSATSTTPSTASTPSGTSQTSTGQTSTATEARTTTLICPLTEGMNNPQYINKLTIIGAPSSASPSDINPDSPGVDFNEINPSVTVPFQPGITPIVVSVSVPNKNTNVDKITVIIKEPSGTILVNQVSPTGTNKVDTFPITPLPEKSTMTVTFGTKNGQPPENVTLSIIACYTPSTATMIVTSSTVPPSVSGSTPALTISSTSTGVTQGATTPAGTPKYMSSPLASIPSAMSTTPSTASTPSRTPPTSTGQTSTASEAMTTTIICPLTEGMNNPQYINDLTIIGAPSSASPSDINPDSPGVDFNEINPSVTVPFQPGITPIVVSVSVPNKNTNVDKITVIIKEPSVIIKEPSGTILVNEVSPTGTNKVDTFPITPLPEKSTMTVTFGTHNGQPPENVTLSIIACYTPSTATTIVTSSTVPPSVSGSIPILTISSTASVVTQAPSSTSSTSTAQTSTASEAMTTTLICPLTEGMNNPQYINDLTIIGAPSSASPSDINPDSPGVDFNEMNPSVTVPFQPGITPIVVSVSVPNKNTNVDKITVIIKEPSG
ncbi:unnamed protein product, partial [Rotaria sp. Silwood1]